MSARKALRYNVNIALVVIRILAMPFKSKSVIGSYVWSDFRMTLKWKRTNKTEKQTNGDRAIWLVLSNGYKHAWLLVGLVNARAKKLLARELSSNQPILRFDIILQQDWPIEQWLLYIRVFFGGKTKRPCLDLFIHWLLKQITNTYRNHFSRSYEDCSIRLLKTLLD